MFRGAIYNTLSEAYLGTLSDIYHNGSPLKGTSKEEQLNNPNNLDDFKELINNDNYYYNRASSKELHNYSFTIKNPSITESLTTKSSTHNKIIHNYTEKETIYFDKGDIHNMDKLSKVWETIKNPDGTVNANYGYMVYHMYDAWNEQFDPSNKMNQWDWAKKRLILNKQTLQAYVHFNRPKDQWMMNLDQPCTMYIQFVIRNDKLNLYANMRSNDIVYGTPYNIAYFIKLLHRMCNELKKYYPNLEVGDYIHHTTSIHYYIRNEDRVKQMLGINTLSYKLKHTTLCIVNSLKIITLFLIYVYVIFLLIIGANMMGFKISF